MPQPITEEMRTDLLTAMREAKPKSLITLDTLLVQARNDIKQMLDRGYTLEEVRDLCKEKGVAVSIAKLKSAMEPSRKKRSGKVQHAPSKTSPIIESQKGGPTVNIARPKFADS